MIFCKDFDKIWNGFWFLKTKQASLQKFCNNPWRKCNLFCKIMQGFVKIARHLWDWHLFIWGPLKFKYLFYIQLWRELSKKWQTYLENWNTAHCTPSKEPKAGQRKADAKPLKTKSKKRTHTRNNLFWRTRKFSQNFLKIISTTNKQWFLCNRPWKFQYWYFWRMFQFSLKALFPCDCP